MESYTTEQASQYALEWCNNNQEWKRICDIKNTNTLYYTFAEIPKKVQKQWIREFGEHSAESAWLESGKKPCKVPYGFITGKGEFYEDILQVPLHHNMMQVYKVG
ncbi:hypothetical protein SMD22_00865 (plasmid) [Brevibacillus halotolerans]|nr:hypothetical protein SMD22_00865 [Brevibacillus halotolerans]